MSTPMLLGRLVQFGTLNIFRYGGVAKAPPSGHGGHFTVKWPPWPLGGAFAMSPYLKMFTASNCTSVPSFMLLASSEWFTSQIPGLLSKSQKY